MAQPPLFVTRFVITHVNACDGLRRLTFAQRGRDTYATREEAEAVLELFKGPQGLPKVLSASELATLEVREMDCWANHFDPVRFYVDGVDFSKEV